MLREELVARIALLVSVVGILGLFAFNSAFSAEEISIGEIDKNDVGKKVQVEGIVKWFHRSRNVLMFDISDGNKIKGVIFNPSIQELKLVQKDSFLRVEGKVAEYRGELEIIAERVGEWLN